MFRYTIELKIKKVLLKYIAFCLNATLHTDDEGVYLDKFQRY